MSNTLQLDAKLEFSASPADDLNFGAEEFRERIGDGFNEFGVRENTDGEGNTRSVDVVFEAMEPGPPEKRNGVRITEEFLRTVASKEYQDPPHLKDHRSGDTFADLGRVKRVWFSELNQKLNLMVRVPNTGAPTHTEAISRYTFQPPAIRNGSVGFGNDYTAVKNDDGEPELVDAKLREFSTVNFPGGYDDGGLATAFAEAATAAIEFDDEADEEEVTDDDASENSAADFSFETETITI